MIYLHISPSQIGSRTSYTYKLCKRIGVELNKTLFFSCFPLLKSLVVPVRFCHGLLFIVFEWV